MEGGINLVSTWWLLVAFLGGGYTGLLLLALLNVARDTSDDALPLSARRRGGLRGDVAAELLTRDGA